MNFISETRMPKENMKKEKTLQKFLSAYMLHAVERHTLKALSHRTRNGKAKRKSE